MTERPKLQTVAQAAGVSITAASQALRGTGRISASTREKVLAAARALNYIPDARAAAMRSRHSREIGFVVHQLSNPFNAEVISGVSDQLESEGFMVAVLDARGDAARQGRHLEAFIRNGRDGLLWVPAIDTPAQTHDLLEAQGTPVVTFLRQPQRGAFDHVGIRDAEATGTATRHLTDLGHRHIAFFGGTEMTSVRTARIAGCRDEMARRGLGSPVIWDCPDAKHDGLDAMMALRAAHPETTAIVCNGDMVALGACLALDRLGLRAGHDMSVVGFDDIRDAAVATPPLTTMAVDPYAMGRTVARALLERIADPAAPRCHTELPAVLTVRETTGPVR